MTVQKKSINENNSAERNIKDKEIEDLKLQLEELKKSIAVINNATSNKIQDTKVVMPVMKMDQPCTLVHLTECSYDLPDTIFVNHVRQDFTRFGETRTFRFVDMQNIVSRYRNWFDRGIFALGEDCEQFKEELGIGVLDKAIPVSVYNTMEKLNINDFEKLVKKLTDIQRIQLTKTWIQRYNAKVKGYSDLNKIRILNNYTKTSDINLKDSIELLPKEAKQYILDHKQEFKQGMATGIINEVENAE